MTPPVSIFAMQLGDGTEVNPKYTYSTNKCESAGKDHYLSVPHKPC